MEENWRFIPGYEGLYEVSNLGNVRSVTAKIYRNNGTTYIRRGKLLGIRDFGKYTQVILSKQGNAKCYGVHRLVAQAFIPNPDNLPCVNHKDEDRTNNCVDNLEWCTYKYNNEYNDRVDKCRQKISNTLRSKTTHHKMTPEQIEHIRQGAKKGWQKRKMWSAITEMEEV